MYPVYVLFLAQYDDIVIYIRCGGGGPTILPIVRRVRVPGSAPDLIMRWQSCFVVSWTVFAQLSRVAGVGAEVLANVNYGFLVRCTFSSVGVRLLVAGVRLAVAGVRLLVAGARLAVVLPSRQEEEDYHGTFNKNT